MTQSPMVGRASVGANVGKLVVGDVGAGVVGNDVGAGVVGANVGKLVVGDVGAGVVGTGVA